MKKHLQLLALLVALFVPCVMHAQDVQDYQFATGTDATKWVTMTSSATTVTSIADNDDAASSVMNIGFTFQFAGQNYTQWSVNSNGRIRLGSTAVSTGYQAPFANQLGTDLPMIAPFTGDFATYDYAGGYVKYQLTGSSPNRVLVIELALDPDRDEEGVNKVQAQLFEGTNMIRFVYGTAYNTTPSNVFQIGLCYTSTDYLLVNPTTHTTGSATSTTYTSWPGTFRYYEFTPFIPTCPRPGSVVASNLSTSSANLAWHPLGTESEWYITYTDGTSTYDMSVYDTTATITGLDANTVYTASVHAVCSSSDTSQPGNVSFRTLCNALTLLPYTQNFESENTTSSNTPNDTWANCWHHLNNGTSYMGYPYISSSSTYNHTVGGTKGLYWGAITTTGTYGDYHCIVFPAVDTDVYAINTLQVTMWAKASSTSYNPAFQIGVMSDPTDINTFQQVGSVNISGNTAWNEYITSLSTFTGNGQFVAIKAVRPSSTWYAYVDDLMLSVEPQCPRVENMAVTNVGINSADISWTEMGNGTSWTVEYGPAGFTPGDTNGSVAYAYDTVITLTGLNGNTAYDVYVTVDCGSDVGGVNSTTFRTLCNALDSLPYTQNFEAENTTSTTTPNETWANCWHHLNNGTSYMGYPYISSSSTYNHTVGGTKGLYWGASTTTGTYGDYHCIVFPAVDTDAYAINTLQVKFWAKASSTSYSPVFQVGVMSDPTDITTFQQVGTVNVGSNTTWTEYLTALGNFTGHGQFVAIKSVRPSSTWYAYVDDLTLEVAPQCPDVVALAATSTGVTSIGVEWNLQGGIETPASYDVEITEMGDNASGIPDTYTATSTSYLFTGLNAGTQYKIRVRATCSSDNGAWDSIMASTSSLPCVQLDPTTADTVIFGTGTTSISGCIAYSSWGNTAYQTIYTAAELHAAGLQPGPITGIDLGMTVGTSYSKELTIYLGNSNVTSISSATLVSPVQHQLVFGPQQYTAATGYHHFEFDQPFVWDGTSSIMMTTLLNQYGSSQSSSSGWAGYYTSATNKAAYRYQDSNPFSASNINAGNSGSTYSYRANIRFYTGECMTYATCVAPNAVIDSTDPYNIYVSWAAGYQESAWSVQYRQGTSGSWTTVESSTSDNYTTISNLTPATNYQVRVGALCSDGTEYTTLDVQTPCVPAQLPYTENFDSWTTSTSSATGVLPTCWSYTMTNASYSSSSYVPQIYYSTSYANSGNYCLRLYGVGYHCLPEMSASLDSLQITFWNYCTSTSYAMEVGVLEGDGTFVPIQTVVPPAASTHFEVELNFSSYTGTSRTIAFRNYYVNSTTGYSYNYIDDITVDYIPACPRVSQVNTRNISGSHATAYWTASPNAIEYQVEYGTHGTPQGYGTVLSVYEDSIQLTNLNPTTAYDVYVRSICSSGDTSWARSVTFTTACGELTSAALPFVEDFETQATTSSTSSTFIPCWGHLNNGTSYMGYPYLSSSTTYNHTVGGTKGLYWSGSTTTGTYGDYYVIVLPPVDTNDIPVNTLQLKFWAKASSTSYHPTFLVGVMTDPTNINSFQTVSTINVNPGSSTDWAEFSTEFDNFTGAGQYIAIRGNRPTSTWYAYMDDITLRLAPTCFEVTNVHLSDIDSASATVTWTPDSRSSVSGYTVEYGPYGFPAGTGTSSTEYGTSFQMTGLTPDTRYTVYITAECTSGDNSYPVRFDFRTDCAGLTQYDLPYTYGFEDATGTSSTSDINSCWKRLNNYSTYPYPSSTTPHSGGKCLYFYSSTTPYWSVAIMPAYNDGLENLQLKFWNRASSTSTGYGDMQVGIMTDPYDINTFQLIATCNNNTTNWVQQTVAFGSYTGTGKYIAFRKPGTGSGYTYLDDITLDFLPTCPEMRSMAVNNTRAVSTNVTWSYQSGIVTTDPEFEMEVVETQTQTTVVSETGLTGFSHLISGLSPNTQYTVRMRAACQDGSYGPWASVNFQTRCISGGDSEPSGTETQQYSGVPVNSAWGNTACQSIYTAAQLSAMGVAAGPIYGIKYTWSNTGSYTKEFTIFMKNSTTSTASTTLETPGTQYYTGTHSTSVTGQVTYNFTTPFMWDGTSNIMITTFMNQSGSSQSSSGFYGLSSACTGSRSAYRYQDSNPFTASNINAGNAGSAVAYLPNVTFVTPCDTNATCAAPNAVIDSCANGDLYISWAPGYMETSWDVDYRQGTTGSWTSLATGTSNTDAVITGVSPNTRYQIRVGALCSDTTAYALLDYTTPCAPYAVPFSENFATFSTSTTDPLPNCWEKHTNYSTNYPYASTSYSRSGGRSMYMYSTSSTYTYMVLPLFAPAIDSLQVSFWLYRTNTSYTHALEVGVMTDPADVTTFQLVGTATPSQLSTWEPFEIQFSNYHGQGRYIAIMSPNGVYSYPYLDDLSVEYISSCPRVTNVTASNITQNSARIQWTGTSASEYELEYGPAGFTRGQGNFVSVQGDDSITLFGLHASTTYDVYVRGICLPDTGNWSFAYHFNTICGMIDSLPFSENFNNIGTSTSVHGPNCWYGYSSYSTSYPYPSTSYNRSGSGAAMYMYHYNNDTNYTMLQLPPVDTTVYPINTLELDFSLCLSTTSYTQGIVVGVCPAQGYTGFVPIDTVIAASTTGVWQDFEVQLSRYAGSGNYITMLCYAGNGSSYAYPYLDDVTLRVAPTCLHPNDAMATTVTCTDAIVRWTPGDSTQTDFLVRYGHLNCNVDTCQDINVSYADSIMLTGLDTGAYYDFYVATLCPDGDTTPWAHVTFRTLAGAPVSSFPYICTFAGNEGNGWTLAGVGQTNQWYIGNAAYNPGSDNMGLYVSNDGGLTNAYTNTAISYAWAYRTLDLQAGEYAYSFDWKGQGESAYYDFLRPFLVPASVSLDAGVVPGGSTYTYATTPAPAGWIDLSQVTTAPYTLNMQSTWQTVTGTFVITQAGTYNLAFSWANDGSGGSNPPSAVDNIYINRNTCPQVQNFAAPNVTHDSIYLTWNPGGTESTWYVELDSAGIVLDSNVTTDSSYVFGGLTDNSSYTVRVYSLCDAGDTSMASVMTLRTPCLPMAVPYSINFDNETDNVYPNCWSYTMTGTSTYQTGSYLPKVYNYSTYAHSGSKTLWLYGVGYFCLPPMSVPLDSLQISFYDYSTSTYYGLELGVMEGNTFVPIQDVTPTATSTSQHQTIYLSSYHGSSRIIAFRNYYTTSTTVYYSYHYLDDIVVDYIPTCPPCTNLHSTSNNSSSVTLTWQENGSAAEWQIAVESSSTATPTPDTTVYAYPTTIGGLTSGQSYYFYVRSVCGAGDTSPWSEYFMCAPGSWNMRVNQTDTLYTCGAVVYDDGGPNGAYAMSQNSTLILMPGQPGNIIQVSGSSYTESSFDYITIYDGIGIGGTQLWTDNGISTLTNFGPFLSTSGPITVTFHTDGSVAYDGFTINVQCVSVSCRVLNVRLDNTIPESDQSLAVTWDTTDAFEYQVEYGLHGFVQGTGTLLTAYTNSVMINNLTASTLYDVYVRSICNSGDTGSWTMATFQTAMCANAHIASTGTPSGTSNAAPVNNYWNYSLTETIIDSAELGGPQSIGAISYYYDYGSSSSAKTDVDIYLMPTTKTSFLSTSDIVEVDSTAVLVYSGNLNCSQGWNIFMLDTAYDYDGLTNLMVIVDDNSGDYDGSSYVFATASCTDYKTITYYSDSYHPTIGSLSSYSGTKTYYQWRPVMQLISCGAAGCGRPTLGAATHTYESATVNWTGTGNSYEVSILNGGTWSTEVPVTGTSYTFNNLSAATTYSYRVRQDCSIDSLGYSEWAIGTFTTDSMPCLAPTNFQVAGVSGNSATFTWTAADPSHNAWEIHVYNTTFDSIYPVSASPATIINLQPGVDYTAQIRTLCGVFNDIEGAWSDTVHVMPATCPDVTGLDTVSVGFNQVVLQWTADPMAQSWIVEYGIHGFNQGSGTTVTVTTPTYTATGLTDMISYDFYVRAVCGTNWESENWQSITVTTDQAPANTFNVTVNVNNSNWGSVIGGGIVAADSTIILTAQPADHCEFLQWTDGVTANPRTVVVTCDTAFTANFGQIPQYTITVVSENEEMGTVTGGGTYYRGETATFEATANSGYQFMNWTDGNGDNPRTITVTGDATYTAHFDVEGSVVNYYTVNLTVNNPDWGYVTGAGTYVENSTITIAAIANSGYHFVTWNDGVSDAERQITVVSDVDLLARFAENEGIDDVDGMLSCTIYPNPAHNTANISVSGVNGQVRIAVLDMSGRVVASETMECNADCVKSMDVDGLAAGTYFVRVTSEKVNMVKKLIVR